MRLRCSALRARPSLKYSSCPLLLMKTAEHHTGHSGTLLYAASGGAAALKPDDDAHRPLRPRLGVRASRAGERGDESGALPWAAHRAAGKISARRPLLAVIRQTIGRDPRKPAARAGVVLWRHQFGMVEAGRCQVDLIAEPGRLECQLGAAPFAK